MGSIHEKNQGPKISCYCTFKQWVLTDKFKILVINTGAGVALKYACGPKIMCSFLEIGHEGFEKLQIGHKGFKNCNFLRCIHQCKF